MAAAGGGRGSGTPRRMTGSGDRARIPAEIRELAPGIAEATLERLAEMYTATELDGRCCGSLRRTRGPGASSSPFAVQDTVGPDLPRRTDGRR